MESIELASIEPRCLHSHAVFCKYLQRAKNAKACEVVIIRSLCCAVLFEFEANFFTQYSAYTDRSVGLHKIIEKQTI